MFEVRILCDDRRGDPLGKRKCESHRGRDSIHPSGEGPTVDQASRGALRSAKEHGWRKQRRPGRSPATAFICSTCWKGNHDG